LRKQEAAKRLYEWIQTNYVEKARDMSGSEYHAEECLLDFCVKNIGMSPPEICPPYISSNMSGDSFIVQPPREWEF